MGLSFGWKANDVRETIWRGDSALKNVPDHVIDAWQKDGDASHLRQYATAGEPTVFEFRALNPEESRVIYPLLSEGTEEGVYQAFLSAFRMGVTFPGHGTVKVDDPEQGIVTRALVARERGIQKLALPFIAYLEEKYPGIVAFYGSLILNATFPTEPEKKASSPLSTPTPSSEGGNTPGGTAPPAQDMAGPPLA